MVFLAAALVAGACGGGAATTAPPPATPVPVLVPNHGSGYASTGPMSVPRWGHTATLLASGQVLIAGGGYGDGPTAELYTP